MRKVGIYGGSFNPVHYGHTGLAQWVLDHSDLDEVWLMVSPNNPLKAADELADEQTRLAGVREALKTIGDPRLKASDFEFDMPRPNYTANTLRQLRKVYPESEFILIIGEDNLKILNRWREWEYLLDEFEIIVYPRHDDTLMAPAVQERLQHGAHVRIISNAPYFDISSTQIRAMQHT